MIQTKNDREFALNKKKKKDHLVWIVLLSLFAFHLINNMVIVFRDATPLMADASGYYKLSFSYWKTWTDFAKCGDLNLLLSVLNTGLGGELLALLAVPFFSVFGVSHDIAILANQVFFLILLFSIFGIGKILFDRKTGFLAAAMISLYPGTVGFSRVYMLEFPILAISTLCVYLLIKSEGFKNFKYGLAFGLAFAAGELLRPRFAVYITIPVLFYVIKNIAVLFRRTEVPAHISAAKMAINILSSAVLSCLILFPWYSMDKISGYLSTQKLWFSWPALPSIGLTAPHYLQVLLRVSLGWFFTFLFFGGMVVSFFEKRKRPKIYFLLTWCALTFILLSAFGLKDFPRLVIPLLAPIALVSSAGMEGLSKLKNGKYLTIIFLVLSVFQYFFMSYYTQRINEKNEPLREKEELHRLLRVPSQGLLQAGSDDWTPDELLSLFRVRRNSDKTWSWGLINPNVKFLIGRDFYQWTKTDFHQWTSDVVKVLYVDVRGTPICIEMEERILTDNLPIVVMGLYQNQFNWKILFSNKEFQHMVLGADYVIIHKGTWSKGGFIDTIFNIFSANISRFEELKTIKTPWSKISIYGRKIEDTSNGNPVPGATS